MHREQRAAHRLRQRERHAPFYRKTYKRAPKDAVQLNAFEIGIVYPADHASRNGHGETDAQRPQTLPSQPAGPMASATESPGEGGATAPEAATWWSSARRQR